jgi:hypothetical protein
VYAKPVNRPAATAEIAVFCKVFMYYSLLLKSKKGLMLIAWSDHDGRGRNDFLMIHRINAIALIWCFLLPHYCEIWLILAIYAHLHPF